MLLNEMIASNGDSYKKSTTKFDVMMMTSKSKDEEIYKFLRKKRKIVNRYPNVKALSRKDQFQDMMKLAS